MNVRKLFVYLGIALALSSCSARKTVLQYFTDLPAEGSIPAGDFTLKIVPDDELIINVSALDPEAVEDYAIPYQRSSTRDFNTPLGEQMESELRQRRSNALSYDTYRVNKEGFITFPVIGKIHVAGMTLDGLAEYLTEKISEKVNDPIVTVELVNFHVSIMGDVQKPGIQLITRERVSILDAIANAGDLTAYGERKRVLLIREEDGQRLYHYLNLNDKDLLSSPYFYLKQNDVIYVEPNAIKSANVSTDQERQFKLSMTSVIVSAASVIASLAIALLVK